MAITVINQNKLTPVLTAINPRRRRLFSFKYLRTQSSTSQNNTLRFCNIQAVSTKTAPISTPITPLNDVVIEGWWLHWSAVRALMSIPESITIHVE